MSHRKRYTSPLLLRVTTTTIIWVISPGAIATKVHNNDLPIGPPRSQKVGLTYISACLYQVH
jgi:hypothetical protein